MTRPKGRAAEGLGRRDREGADHEARDPDHSDRNDPALYHGVRLYGRLRLEEPGPAGVHRPHLQPHGGRRRRGHRHPGAPGGGDLRRRRGGHRGPGPRPGRAGGRRTGGGLPLPGRGGPEPPPGGPPAPAGAGAAFVLPSAGEHGHRRRPAGPEHRGRHDGPQDLCRLRRPDGPRGPGPHLQEPGHPPGLVHGGGRPGHQRHGGVPGRPDPGPPERRRPGHHLHPGEPVGGLLR